MPSKPHFQFLNTLPLLLVFLLSAVCNAQITMSDDFSPSYNGKDDPWNVGDNLFVGEVAESSMLVEGGAIVESSIGYLGYGEGAKGTATITGSGSRWSPFWIEIGRSGEGVLNIVSGGELTTQSLGVVGREDDSLGTINVIGANSRLEIGRDMVIGRKGFGTVNVKEEAFYGSVRATTIANGIFNLEGIGSRLEAGSWLNVGGGGAVFGGDHGVLNIKDGAMALVTRTQIGVIGSSGVVTIAGSGSLLESSEQLQIGSNLGGNGTLNLIDGGKATSQITVVSNDQTTGFLNISGPGSQLITASDLRISNNLGTGTMLLENGGFLSNVDGYLGYANSGTGIATVTGQHTHWLNSGDLKIGRAFIPGLSEGAGILNVQEFGKITVGGTLTIELTGVVNLDGGILEADTLIVTSDGGEFNYLSGTLDVAHFDGGLTQDGGILAPGNSPGVFAISQDYVINDGAIEIELGGVEQGIEYDFLEISGAATINGGTLEVHLIDDFENSISPSNEFTIFTAAGGLTGEFAGHTDDGYMTSADGQYMFQVSYSENSITLRNFTVNPSTLLGDVNLDGAVNFLDISPFISLLSLGDFTAEADVNIDGSAVAHHWRTRKNSDNVLLGVPNVKRNQTSSSYLQRGIQTRCSQSCC